MSDSDSLREWVAWTFSPAISAILVTLIISLLSPLLIHLYLYQKAPSKELPTFLLVGPSGSGKTTLLTLVCNMTVLSCALLTCSVCEWHPLRYPYEPRAADSSLSITLDHPVICRQVSLRERYFRTKPTQIPPTRHARPWQATASRNNTLDLTEGTSRPAVCGR